jgi:ABC-type spermidine/putrescine transport system permease subunit I
MLVILPFWTSFLIRVYAWIGILKPEGPAQPGTPLGRLHRRPASDHQHDIGVVIGIVYSYLPFMILPVYAALERMDRSLLEAAADLGSTPCEASGRSRSPLSLPGVLAGSLLVFIPAVGEFRHPRSSGRLRHLMIGRTLWSEFFPEPRLAGRQRGRDCAAGHPGGPDRAVSERAGERQGHAPMKRFSAFNLASVVVGFAFLYLPILLLVLFSFNESRLVTVWGGFSTKWYAALLRMGPCGRCLDHAAGRGPLGNGRHCARHARGRRAGPAGPLRRPDAVTGMVYAPWSCPK